MAQGKSTSPDAGERAAAMKLGKASIIVSLAGIIVGSAIIVLYLIVYFAVYNNNDHNNDDN